MYLVVDVETGGTDPQEHALLSVAAIVLEKDLSEMGRFEALIQPRQGYQCMRRALEINHINLAEHEQNASPYHLVAQEFRDFVNTFSQLMIVGWNVTFDKSFIEWQLLDEDFIPNTHFYRTLDLHAVKEFLAACGKLPHVGSLQDTARYLGLLEGAQSHTAMGDALLTANIFRALKAKGK